MLLNSNPRDIGWNLELTAFFRQIAIWAREKLPDDELPDAT